MTDKTWLTVEAADRLARELADAEGPKRADIVKKIEDARAEGDLKENGDEMHFLLGSREIEIDGLDVFSEKSPLGSAVLGQKIGESVTYTAPNGKEIKVTIKDAQYH